MAVAKINLDTYDLHDRITLIESDLYTRLPNKKYDLIITNPPYVDAQAMAELPPEYAHEPAMALGSGEDGLDIVRRILKEAPDHLTPNGALLCEIGRGRDLLEAEFPNLPLLWLDTEESAGEVFFLRAADLVG